MVPAEPAEIRTVYGRLYSTDKLGNLFKCSTLLFEFIPFMEAMNFFLNIIQSWKTVIQIKP